MGSKGNDLGAMIGAALPKTCRIKTLYAPSSSQHHGHGIVSWTERARTTRTNLLKEKISNSSINSVLPSVSSRIPDTHVVG